MAAMRRRFRCFVSLFAIVAFLFAEGAMAAYACAGPAVDPVAAAQMKAQMESDGGLCEKHCATGTVSFEIAKPAPSSIPVAATVALRIMPAPAAFLAAPAGAEALSVAGPAPPLIRFTVLRI